MNEVLHTDKPSHDTRHPSPQQGLPLFFNNSGLFSLHMIHCKNKQFPGHPFVQVFDPLSSFTSDISPFFPSCTISISTLTFRVVKNAPPLQLSYVPILPSPSVAQPHTAFDVPVPLGEDWNNKKHHPTSLGWYHWWFKNPANQLIW